MSAAGRTAAWAIVGYQRLLSPFLPPSCRFVPSCSEYARVVLTDHGFIRGSWLAIGRLVRCHPFHAGGYDPPPTPRAHDDTAGRRRVER